MRIPGLSKLIKALIVVCKVIDLSGNVIRPFVPSGDLSNYDTALAAIKANCDVIRAIDYMDSVAGTNPLWGQR